MFKLIVLFSFCLTTLLAANCAVSTSQKMDCGYYGIDQSKCESRGCCWVPVSESSGNVPWCFYPSGHTACTNLNLQGTTPGFTSADFNTMKGYFYSNLNIDGKGGVVASPSTSNPDYYYNWMRDGSLSMRAFMDINDNDYNTIQAKMNEWIQWVLVAQNQNDPNGIDIRVEPKFNLPNGNVYTGGWCRPQDDGPSLRATTMMQYADILFNNGQSSVVSQYLWTTGAYNGGTIKYDLDWVANNFIGYTTCDLWEEVRNEKFFWNYFNTRKAMIIGAQFASKMGDSSRQQKYSYIANQIESAINSTFWTGSYIMESSNRKQDGATICALNKGYNNDHFISATNAWVPGTIKTLNAAFCTEYPLNNAATAQGIPGVLYGRYPGDVYYGGNPWFLISAALGELFYRGASITGLNGLADDEFAAWKDFFEMDETNGIQDVQDAMTAAGDAVMYRIYTYAKRKNFHLSEQIDKNTGDELSARDLTWSYSNVLCALKIRDAISNYTENMAKKSQ